MPETWVAVLALASLSFVTSAAGVALAVRISRSETWIAVGVGFSTGIMVLVSLGELVPEALAQAGPGTTALGVGLGVALIASLNVVVPHTHLGHEGGALRAREVRAAYLIAFGLILHDVPEGFAMANSYIASPSLGILVAIAIALHNLPEEFAMAVPVAALQTPRALYEIALLSALAEPVGALLGLVLVNLVPGLNAAFLGFAAGAMLFVSAHELLPMASRYRGGLRHFAGRGRLRWPRTGAALLTRDHSGSG